MSSNTPPSDRDCHDETTQLLLDGVAREDVTKTFLVGIHELADDEGLTINSISVGEYRNAS